MRSPFRSPTLNTIIINLGDLCRISSFDIFAIIRHKRNWCGKRRCSLSRR